MQLTDGDVRISLYRPFSKQWLFFSRRLNERVYLMPSLFPRSSSTNVVISTTGVGNRDEFSAIITDAIPDLHAVDKSGGGQCFPLYLYQKVDESLGLQFDKSEVIDGYRRRDAITDAILKIFRGAYGEGAEAVTKEDIFYYVYGVMHSPQYRTRFAADLKKMLPRIPLTKETKDFWAFSKEGRELAQWHLNYETVTPWPVEEIHDKLDLGFEDIYKLSKMTFARPSTEQKAAGAKWDKTCIIYNSHVAVSKIPLEAYDYVVNGKSAIEWVMERYQLTRDKDSGIVNDPNDWCKELKQSRYIIDLVGRVVRVSMETIKIVKRLPALNEINDAGART